MLTSQCWTRIVNSTHNPVHLHPHISLTGKRVTVMGLGRFGGGAAAARYAAKQGARVTVTDLASKESLRTTLDTLADVPLEQIRLGTHAPEDFRTADVVIVNPAVADDSRFLQIARDAGALLTSELELFLSACPCRLIAVTGTNGKSTTAAMTAHLLRASGKTAWLGGNIGGSLLSDLPGMTSDDWAVLEISSFQLDRIERPQPYFSRMALTNFSPNHLDRHGTLEAYAAAKRRLYDLSKEGAVAVVDVEDPALSRWLFPDNNPHLKTVFPLPTDRLPPLAVPGAHNRKDAAFAATLAVFCDCAESEVFEAVATFGGLPHRLQPIPSKAARRCIDDSASTTPESTVAALQSLDGPVWLLAGGKDKGMDLDLLLTRIPPNTAGVAFFGSVASGASARLLALSPDFPTTAVETLDDAYAWAISQSRPNDTLLLSPAFASTDQYVNYAARAEAFRRLAGSMSDTV